MIARDLTPARPLPAPGRRVAWLAPFAAAIVVAVPLVQAFRPDWLQLGLVRGWMFTGAEAIFGLVIIALALRESIPGRSISSRSLATVFTGAFLAPLALTGATVDSFAIGPPERLWLAHSAICFRTSVLAAIPAILVAAILASRGLAVRPGITGALYGLGSGVIADAGLRLFCEYSQPSHVIAAHLGAIAVSMAVGAGVARGLQPPRITLRS
jgi:hypothetical protein